MIKKYLPKSLLVRAISIVILPMIVFQLIIVTVFFDSLWERVIARMSRSVAMEIALTVNQIKNNDISILRANRDYGSFTEMNIKIISSEDLTENYAANNINFLDFVTAGFKRELQGTLNSTHWVQSVNDNINVYVNIGEEMLRITFPKKRVSTARVHIFLGWVIISSAILIFISFLFLRNQIKPITQLAMAAEEFGKGNNVSNFKVSGASDVRRAAIEFLKMKNRIIKQVEQRSLMLAGVSHDLKTPLTRMRLQAEAIEDDKSKEFLIDEIKHMNLMLEEYLNFSKEENIKDSNKINPIEAIIKIKNDIHFNDKNIDIKIINDAEIELNANIFNRSIINLLNNSFENAQNVKIIIETSPELTKVEIHDDGEGIPETERANVFKPFYRIDKSRNQNSANSGLGLSTTKHLLSSINGTIELGESKSLGGLKVRIEIPN
ncbi:ATP-binding protein [Pelagibacteraceae bacterium]|nr:ATP-binding protein [Pelagibacteraceae bacterium]